MKEVTLIPYNSQEHRSYLFGWLTDDELMRGWGMAPFKKEDLPLWVDDPTRVILIVGEKENGQIVGFVDFYKWDKDKGVASRGTLIDPKYQNKGYGKAAILESNRYAFTRMGLKRIDLYVQGDNKRSRHITEKLGYKLDKYDSGQDRFYYFIEK